MKFERSIQSIIDKFAKHEIFIAYSVGVDRRKVIFLYDGRGQPQKV